ncbi:MAG: hypothetical protein AAFX58_06675 [Pseudomonadota bacterium]
MPSTADPTEPATTLTALADALAANDWERAAMLCRQLRETPVAAGDAAALGSAHSASVALLEDVTERRAAVAAELRQLLSGRRAAAAYAGK